MDELLEPPVPLPSDEEPKPEPPPAPDEHAEPGPPEVPAEPAPAREARVRAVLDCTTGESKAVPLTEDEEDAAIAEREATRTERTEREVAVKASRDSDLEVVRAKAVEDPAFAALARVLGVDVPVTSAPIEEPR